MIERADISSVLSQMRELRAEAQQGIRQIEMPEVNQVRPNDQVERTDFTELLKGAVDVVANEQAKTSALRNAYERGDEGIDLAQVMIQAQKSSVAFDALTQVRNRLITAYEDISKMPI